MNIPGYPPIHSQNGRGNVSEFDFIDLYLLEPAQVQAVMQLQNTLQCSAHNRMIHNTLGQLGQKS